ncbi:unnamed protein product [Linum trigynum]|uniref:Uncharacterized protein n=1 Tax=Linum trigynum TaxID=586398 RepID=A0AAV2CYA2_9ROSI
MSSSQLSTWDANQQDLDRLILEVERMAERLRKIFGPHRATTAVAFEGAAATQVLRNESVILTSSPVDESLWAPMSEEEARLRRMSGLGWPRSRRVERRRL